MEVVELLLLVCRQERGAHVRHPAHHVAVCHPSTCHLIEALFCALVLRVGDAREVEDLNLAPFS